MAITALPTPPSRQDPTNFNDRADAFLGALPAFGTEANALQTDVNAKQVIASNAAIAASTSETNALAYQNAASATANTVRWVSGTTYANGANVFSPITFFTYRRITASGSGTTDPSADPVNWTQISGEVPGIIKMWPTATAPVGHLLCNGQAVSRTTYAALFATVGTTFGAGDSSTTFNLPDYRDRMPMGAGTSYSAGAIGGYKDATLPSHSHGLGTLGTTTAGAHTHGIGIGQFRSSNCCSYPYPSAAFDGGQINGALTTEGNHTHGMTGALDAAGSSATGMNIPPFSAIYFIIKT